MNEKVTLEIVTPRKPLSAEAKPRLTVFFKLRLFLCKIIIILLYYTEYCLNTLFTLRLVSKQFRSSGYLCLYIPTSYIQTLRWRQSGSMVSSTRIHFAKSIYSLKVHPSSNNINLCQVPSRAKAWFHDSAGYFDMYHLFLSQSESRIYMNEWYYRITNTSSKIFSRSINLFCAWCKFCSLTSLLSTANFSFVETISSHSFRCCPKYLLFQNKQWQSLKNFFSFHFRI